MPMDILTWFLLFVAIFIEIYFIIIVYRDIFPTKKRKK